MTEFYTYLHTRPDGSIFYVGKGSGMRSHTFTRNRNQHYKNVIAKYGVENIGVFIFPCDSEAQAFADEIQQIAQLRRDGCVLVNATDGGEGKSGCIPTQETREKLVAALRGNKRALGGKSKTGLTLSDATKEKIRSARIGKKHTRETCERMKVSNAGKKRFLGKSHTAESKAKTSASLRAASAKKGVTNASGYRGVGWHKASNKWRAFISVGGKSIQLGVYALKEDAALAYNFAAMKYHGNSAVFNK